MSADVTWDDDDELGLDCGNVDGDIPKVPQSDAVAVSVLFWFEAAAADDGDDDKLVVLVVEEDGKYLLLAPRVWDVMLPLWTLLLPNIDAADLTSAKVSVLPSVWSWLSFVTVFAEFLLDADQVPENSFVRSEVKDLPEVVMSFWLPTFEPESNKLLEALTEPSSNRSISKCSIFVEPIFTPVSELWHFDSELSAFFRVCSE